MSDSICSRERVRYIFPISEAVNKTEANYKYRENVFIVFLKSDIYFINYLLIKSIQTFFVSYYAKALCE